MSLKRIHIALYALGGIGAVLIGAISLVAPGLAGATDSHLMRELGAAVVFVGLMALWCIPNYDRRRQVHLAFMVLTALLAAIHWYEYFAGSRSVISPLVNSVPFLVLLAMKWSGPSGENAEVSSKGR